MINSESYIDLGDLLGGFRRDLYHPRYRVQKQGPLRVCVMPQMRSRGYWGDIYSIEGAMVLSASQGATCGTWMSLLPCEMESHEVGIAAAHGHTVVMGLGMGWLAANIAVRPQVACVTVIEKNPDIIDFVERSGILQDLPAAVRTKVQIVHSDALQWQSSMPVDVMLVDIWRKFIEERKLDDARQMQANVGAKHVYFCGQEMELWRFACRHAKGFPHLDWSLLRTIIAEHIRLPLIMPDWPDYPEKIAKGAPWWTPADPLWWRG